MEGDWRIETMVSIIIYDCYIRRLGDRAITFCAINNFNRNMYVIFGHICLRFFRLMWISRICLFSDWRFRQNWGHCPISHEINTWNAFPNLTHKRNDAEEMSDSFSANHPYLAGSAIVWSWKSQYPIVWNYKRDSRSAETSKNRIFQWTICTNRNHAYRIEARAHCSIQLWLFCLQQMIWVDTN